MVGAAEGVTFCAQGDSYEVIKTFFLDFFNNLIKFGDSNSNLFGNELF